MLSHVYFFYAFSLVVDLINFPSVKQIHYFFLLEFLMGIHIRTNLFIMENLDHSN